MNFKQVIAIDPSGNFTNGKGGTGLLSIAKDKDGNHSMEDKTIWAKNFTTRKDYYNTILKAIDDLVIDNENALIVIEDFRLQSGKAEVQTNQAMETSELIGVLENNLDTMNIKYKRQQNSIKARWNNDIIMDNYLNTLGLNMYKLSSRHAKDALRHALHGWFFTKNKLDKEVKNEK